MLILGLLRNFLSENGFMSYPMIFLPVTCRGKKIMVGTTVTNLIRKREKIMRDRKTDTCAGQLLLLIACIGGCTTTVIISKNTTKCTRKRTSSWPLLSGPLMSLTVCWERMYSLFSEKLVRIEQVMPLSVSIGSLRGMAKIFLTKTCPLPIILKVSSGMHSAKKM